VTEKGTGNVTEESFAVDVAKGDFILVKLAGKRSISYFIAEVVHDISGYECEMRYYKRLGNTNKCVLDKKWIFKHSLCDILWKLPPPIPEGMSKCQASQLCCPVDFSSFRAFLAIQNV
jgi:hypothetical protein